MDLFGKKQREKILLQQLEDEMNRSSRVTLTEAQKYQSSKTYTKGMDDMPIVKMFPRQSTVNLGSGALQDITMQDIMFECAFRRLLDDPHLAQTYEERQNEAESLHKHSKCVVFEADSIKQDAINNQFKIIFEAVDAFQKLRVYAEDNSHKRKEHREQIVKAIGKEAIPFSLDTYQIIYEEAIQYKQEINEYEQRIDKLQLDNYSLWQQNKQMKLEIGTVKQLNKMILSEMEKKNEQYNSTYEKLIAVIRERDELKAMWNHDAAKAHSDNQQLMKNLEYMKKQIDDIKYENSELELRNHVLISEMKEMDISKKVKNMLKQQQQRIQQERSFREQRSIAALLNAQPIMQTLVHYLTFDEYSKLNFLNKRFFAELRNSTGVKNCFHYLSILKSSPHSTRATYKSTIDYKVVQFELISCQTGLEDEYEVLNNQENFSSRSDDLQQQEEEEPQIFIVHRTEINQDEISNSQSSVENNQHILSKEEYYKLKSSDALQSLLNKFTHNDYKAGQAYERTIDKALRLLTSYAQLVYTDEQINNIRLQSIEDAYDISQSSDAPQQNVETASVSKQKLKEKLDSFLSKVQSSTAEREVNGYHIQISDQSPSQKNDQQVHQQSPQYLIHNFDLISASNDSQRQGLSTCRSLDKQIRQSFLYQFHCPEDIYKYLVKVGTVLVVERDKITQLFKRIQQSYSELFYQGQQLFKEAKDLEIIMDFYRIKAIYLKSKMQIKIREKEEAWCKEKEEIENSKRQLEEQYNQLEITCLETQNLYQQIQTSFNLLQASKEQVERSCSREKEEKEQNQREIARLQQIQEQTLSDLDLQTKKAAKYQEDLFYLEKRLQEIESQGTTKLEEENEELRRKHQQAIKERNIIRAAMEEYEKFMMSGEIMKLLQND